MNISFPLAHIAGSRVDVDATVTLNALNARADKEIVLQGTIDSISCRSDGEFIDAPVPFTVQYVEIAAVTSPHTSSASTTTNTAFSSKTCKTGGSQQAQKNT